MNSIRNIGGVVSAVLFFRDENQQPDWEATERTLTLLKAKGVDGVCVNGATGEYAAASAAERREVVIRARRVMGGDALVISGAGAPTWIDTVGHARDAEKAGADAHLIPAPHFFPYEQEDLAEFYRRTAEALEKPVLIYNLPQFTGRVGRLLALELIRDPGCNVAGIKDSSGGLDILEALSVDGPREAVRLVGNDSVLAEAMRKGFCGGMISGVAGVLPELNLALWDAWHSQDDKGFESASQLLAEYIEQLGNWPTPWGLKLTAEARGLGRATFALPLSDARKRQAEAFHRWFAPWWTAAIENLAGARNER